MTIDEYINSFPNDVKINLEKIRQVVKKAAPTATEAMSYGMPTFKLNGNLVQIAVFKNHIGFYRRYSISLKQTDSLRSNQENR
jgi:uncharacterized protein YdhG (YjbR/CyaY superfamily)